MGRAAFDAFVQISIWAQLHILLPALTHNVPCDFGQLFSLPAMFLSIKCS